jgi:UDP:flavonoid glycosyltransferase YjiC (YdhE family)
MGSVVMTSTGTAGDVFPFVSMGAMLRSEGYDVSLATHSVYMGKAETSGLRFHATDDSAQFERFLADASLLSDASGWREFFGRHIIPKLRSDIEALTRCSSPSSLILCRATPMIAAKVVSELVGCALLPVVLSPAHVLGHRLYVELISTSFHREINTVLVELGLPTVTDWSKWLQLAPCIALWPDWFANPRGLSMDPILPIGFPMPRDDHSTIGAPSSPIVAGAKVLITGGTGLFATPAFFSSAVSLCEVMGITGLVVCRHASLLPRRLPDGLVWCEEVPSLASVMHGVAAVIHHGGMGVISDACAAGIPQLVLASGGDRPFNGECVRRLGVGATSRLSDSATAMAKVLDGLLTSERVRDSCKQVAAKTRTEQTRANLLNAVRDTSRSSIGCRDRP